MQNNPSSNFDPSETEKALRLIHKDGDVVELRIPRTRWGTLSGYYNDMEKLINGAAEYSGHVPGIYITLNPINPQLLARADNRLERYARWTTSDDEILQRTWLGIDVDPVRPASISSTDAEHKLALTRTREIRDFLRAQLEWPVPILADSGNGGHLLSRIDLPHDNESRDLIKRCLESLDFMFSDEKVRVDIGVFNAARIWKLYGTMSCKGDNVSERPHRLARLLEVE